MLPPDSKLLQPTDKLLWILVEHEELAEDLSSEFKSLPPQYFSPMWSNSWYDCNWLASHGCTDKMGVFRSWKTPWDKQIDSNYWEASKLGWGLGVRNYSYRLVKRSLRFGSNYKSINRDSAFKVLLADPCHLKTTSLKINICRNQIQLFHLSVTKYVVAL